MTERQGHAPPPAPDPVDILAADDPADLTPCDREPIHLSEAIQPHGVLLAVREADLTVVRVSANSVAHLGVEASALVGAPLQRALGAEPVARLRQALHDRRASGADPLVFRLPGRAAYEATWHRIDGLVVVELERHDAAGPLAMSTLFADVRHAMDELQAADGVQGLCDVAAAEVKRLTGYDRVMVYRFHPDDHGEVVAEAREPSLESFRGLHFPASDIPRQARRLFVINPLRVIVDVDYDPAPLLGHPGGDAGPLNLSPPACAACRRSTSRTCAPWASRPR